MKRIARLPDFMIVWLSSYLFFILTLADNFSAAHDSIHYLNDIVNGKNLFHQHHLFYHFLAHKWFVLFSGLFPGVAQHVWAETFTAIWGSSALAVVYLFYRKRFYLSVVPAALCTAVVAFSYGFWFYSVNIEVYMPPLFFILAALYMLTGKELQQKHVWKVAVLHSLAILFHQANILFAIVVLYTLVKNRASVGILKPLIIYSLAGLILTGGSYFVIGWFVQGHNDVQAWISWMQGYTVGHGYWQPLSLSTPLHVFTGFSHAFVGGHFVFQLPVLEEALRQSFFFHSLTDEIYLSRNISPAGAWILTGLTLVLALFIMSLVIRFISRYGIMKIHSTVLTPLLICLLVYSIFFMFWMPEILEFWILQMVLVWLLLGGMLPLIRFPLGLGIRSGLVILAALLFSVNFFGSIYWMQSSRNDWYYKETAKIKDLVTPGDLVIIEDEWILKDYLRYFTPARVLATDEPDFNRQETRRLVEQVIDAKGKVYLYRNASKIAQGNGWSLIQSY